MTSSKDKVDIKQAIIEISNSKLRIEAEQDNIKEIKKRLKDEHGMDVKLIAKLATLHHNQQAEEYRAAADEVLDKYDEIFG